MTNQLRWGILGAAEIARKNWHAILNSGNGIVSAVASRDVARARQFISECQQQFPFAQTPQAMGSYEELLARKDIDAVYIPLPTGLRKEWVLRAAAAGKHIVCEKPCAVRAADLQEMIGACRKHGVQFVDGVMFMHSRRLDALRAVLNDELAMGRIRRIQSSFAFPGSPEFFSGNIRAHSGLEPHGCLGDLGWYCIRFALWTMKEQLPHSVSGRRLAQLGRPDSPAPVATEFSGELLFPEGVSAGFYCSFVTELQQWAHISGSAGNIRIDDFVLPHYGAEVRFEVEQPVFRLNGCAFNMEPHRRRVVVPEYSNNHPTAQETNLFRNLARQVQTGSLNEDWPALALKTQQVMEACFASASQEGRPVPL
jgi:predicted dehydrogenase